MYISNLSRDINTHTNIKTNTARALFKYYLFLFLCFSIIGCSGDEHVRLNKNFSVGKPQNLSPPIINKPIHECAAAVHVTSFAPGALVEVWVNQTERVGAAVPDFGYADVNLTRPLDLGESITATQTVDNVKSAFSINPVSVKAWGPNLTKPNVVPDIWECGRIVSVDNLTPSSRVKIFESDALRGQAEAPRTYKPVVTNQKLTADKFVTAQQFACENDPAKTIISDVSSALQVKPFPGQNFTAPVIDADSLITGNDAVTVKGLYRGALVKVYDQGAEIGSGYANEKINSVHVSEILKEDSVITATQELCEVSPPSDKETPTNKLPAPTIVAPLCDDNQQIRIDGTIINATVVVKQDNVVIAFGGAAGGETLLSLGTPLQAGKPVTVYQYMGETVSPESTAEDVCNCSATDKPRFSADDLANHSAVSCPASTKPLYTTNSNDIMEFELQADWSIINGPTVPKHLSSSPGTLKYVNTGGETISLNVIVNGRGKSRYNHCAFRPLKIDFGSTQSGNIFAGQKKVKLVTHCGNHATDPWILGGTPEVQENRLLSEYYFYEILEQLNSSSLSSRLARITYKNPDGSINTTKYAFWREKEDHACQRCGWSSEADNNNDLSPDAKSVFNAEMTEKFVYNNDYVVTVGHNTIICKNSANNAFYIPYDWDLTGVIRPDYSKNNGKTHKQNAPVYSDWLGGTTPEIRSKVQAWQIVENANNMRAILENSLLQPAGQKHMLGWFDQYINILRCHLSK